MKKLYTTLLVILLAFYFSLSTVTAQSPEKMSYQAVVRDASNNLVATTQVGMQISILQGSATGTAVYVETQAPTTNANGLVTIEIGTGIVVSGNFSTINWGSDIYFIKTETDPIGGTDYTITGTSQLLSVPYALYASTSSSVPVGTAGEISDLAPARGDAIFNSTENIYQIYNGTTWQAFNSTCWPKSTIANAGSDQVFTDGTTTATLSANTSEDGHGIGEWTIVSETSGSFIDTNSPTTIFTGTACTTYVLQWTISTSCDSSFDNVSIEFNQVPTVANAGSDQAFNDGTTDAILSSNKPEDGQGIGKWTIVSGAEGSFADDTDHKTTFKGKLHEVYTLRWTISTCSSSDDDVIICFYKDESGRTLTDIDGNNYHTVWIGTQLWMAANLKVKREADGTAIPLIKNNTEWANLEDNNTDKAYCYYSNSLDSAAKYGALYTYAAAKDACPRGWHLPTDAEWTELEVYIAFDGHSGTEGTALKTKTGWESGGNGTDDYYFSACPGGKRSAVDGLFSSVVLSGTWWTSSEFDSSTVWKRWLRYNTTYLDRSYSGHKSYGYSVRCIKD